MPTYGYRCTACQQELEVFQKITDEPLLKCPHCKKKTLRRGVGGGALIRLQGKNFSEPMSENAACCPCGKNKGRCR